MLDKDKLKEHLYDFLIWFTQYGCDYIGVSTEELVEIFIENYLER